MFFLTITLMNCNIHCTFLNKRWIIKCYLYLLGRYGASTKLLTTYDPKTYTVEEKKGPSVQLKRPF